VLTGSWLCECWAGSSELHHIILRGSALAANSMLIFHLERLRVGARASPSSISTLHFDNADSAAAEPAADHVRSLFKLGEDEGQALVFAALC